ncbi:fra a 1-associated protein [Actinidia eriantha]|uniref:fra a 1-associated protein n=1 Tax=Actinidia eriantha TaxID=165200 RepID=UPI002588F300|nr:fra a 1-associated protein [Actinidia eriantha]
MGWVWKDEADDHDERPYAAPEFDNANPRSSGGDDHCSTRKIVQSHCRTEEVEPGKFVRKCEKTEQIFRDCAGRPSEVVQSNKEYTEEDVSDQMKKGSFPLESSDLVPFDFPGLRSDIEAIERSLFGGLGRFFEAAEEMKNGFFSVFGSPHLYDGDSSSSSSPRQGIPIESRPPKEASPKLSNSESGHVDLSGLARDV